MSKILGKKSKINGGEYDGKYVEELIPIKGAIFSLIKKGYLFTDSVLSEAKITKIIRPKETMCETSIMRHKGLHDNTFKKDDESIDKIIKELSTLENDNYIENCEQYE